MKPINLLPKKPFPTLPKESGLTLANSFGKGAANLAYMWNTIHSLCTPKGMTLRHDWNGRIFEKNTRTIFEDIALIELDVDALLARHIDGSAQFFPYPLEIPKNGFDLSALEPVLDILPWNVVINDKHHRWGYHKPAEHWATPFQDLIHAYGCLNQTAMDGLLIPGQCTSMTTLSAPTFHALSHDDSDPFITTLNAHLHLLAANTPSMDYIGQTFRGLSQPIVPTHTHPIDPSPKSAHDQLILLKTWEPFLAQTPHPSPQS